MPSNISEESRKRFANSLFEKFSVRLRDHIRAKVRNLYDVEDILQDTWIRVIRSTYFRQCQEPFWADGEWANLNDPVQCKSIEAVLIRQASWARDSYLASLAFGDTGTEQDYKKFDSLEALTDKGMDFAVRPDELEPDSARKLYYKPAGVSDFEAEIHIQHIFYGKTTRNIAETFGKSKSSVDRLLDRVEYLLSKLGNEGND